MISEQGTLACTAAGGLVIDVEGERYRIEAGDVKSLIFAGRSRKPLVFSRSGPRTLACSCWLSLAPTGPSYRSGGSGAMV